MKNLISTVFIFSLSVIGIPALSVTENHSEQPDAAAEKHISLTEYSSPEETAESIKSSDFFSVLDISDGQVRKVPVRDYIIGAVCAEMPASFNSEALKAQAVASHTYALYQSESGKNNPDLKGADFSNDPSVYQSYFTDSDIRKYYGDHYDEYYSKVADAVDEVADMILVYNDEPIVAAFHSMSSGMTESAENVWGRKIDYLVPQESSSDTEAPGFTEEYTFTADEIRSRLSAKYESISLPDDISAWFRIKSTSSSGTVLELTAGNTDLTGTEFREIMSLRSADFEITPCSDGNFSIVTKGYGHGVGMSQYGANFMAENGSDYIEILAHYYSGAVLQPIQ